MTEWVPVEVRLPPMEEIEYSDGSGTYFASRKYLVCTPERGKTAWPWSHLNRREMRMARVESDTADSEKQWYDTETGVVLPGVTHWLDGLEPPEGL